MGALYEFNALLRLPENFAVDSLKEGEIYTIEKDDMRVMPLGIPMEMCTHNYKYIAKVRVQELKITPDKTIVTFEVVKMFSPEESDIFTGNFIK